MSLSLSQCDLAARPSLPAKRPPEAGYLGICIIIFYLSKHPAVFSAQINNFVQLKFVGFFLK
jgi:hypothetical protein